MATTTDPTAAVDGFLAAVRGHHGTPGVWAEDALLDAVVPNTQMTLRGAPAIEDQLRTWFRDPGSIEELHRHPIPGGEVIVYTVKWTEDGEPHAARHAHVLELNDAGRIAHDCMWCGGRWPTSQLAELGETDATADTADATADTADTADAD